ncbi:MAG TPA: hypothetical protein VF131_24720 [Blastocatellia bacterium]|nr:hypothetical protein [Blastocatellia bacterium]
MEKPERAVTTTTGWPLPQKIAAGAAVVIVAFLLGYVPSCVGERGTEQEKAKLEHKLRLADLRDKVGMASYEVNRNNYANAAQFSGEFFDGLLSLIGDTRDEPFRQKLQQISARRDEITTNLAQADPVVKEKLAQMYAAFFQATKAEESK